MELPRASQLSHFCDFGHSKSYGFMNFSIYSVRYSKALGFKFTLSPIVRIRETVYLSCSRLDFPVCLLAFAHYFFISFIFAQLLKLF